MPPGLKLSSLELVRGASLAFTGGVPYTCGALTVEGPVTVNGSLSLEDGATLDCAAPGTNDVARLAVNGTLTLPSSGTLKIRVGAEFAGATGSFPLVTAKDLAGTFAGWTRTIEKEADVGVRTYLEGNTLWMEILPSSLTLILR